MRYLLIVMCLTLLSCQPEVQVVYPDTPSNYVISFDEETAEFLFRIFANEDDSYSLDSPMEINCLGQTMDINAIGELCDVQQFCETYGY